MSKRTKMAGLTLVELLVTLVIGALLMSMAVPSFRSSIQRNNTAAQTNQLVAALGTARSEAVKRGRSVVMCQSSNTYANQPRCNGSSWEGGWIVFVNNNQETETASPQRSNDEELIRVYEPLPTGYTLNGSAGVANWVAFMPSGRSSAAGTIMLCYNGQLANSKAVFVNIVGRPRLGRDSNNNLIPEDASGTGLATCSPA